MRLVAAIAALHVREGVASQHADLSDFVEADAAVLTIVTTTPGVVYHLAWPTTSKLAWDDAGTSRERITTYTPAPPGAGGDRMAGRSSATAPAIPNLNAE